MTRVIYNLSNGTIVNTMAEALASGLSYRVTYLPVEVEKAPSRDLRKKIIANPMRFGY